MSVNFHPYSFSFFFIIIAIIIVVIVPVSSLTSDFDPCFSLLTIRP